MHFRCDPGASAPKYKQDTSRRGVMFDRYPFTPFPEGWFFVAHERELARDQLLSRQFLGQDIVAYRDRRGVARVFDAYCPHLGAHLGKTGRLEGDALKCRFHGFHFNGDGLCVRTPCGKPSRSLALRSWPVDEVNGFVFAYHRRPGHEPAWRIPRLDPGGFVPVATRRLSIRSHPQEMSENSVDTAHFAEVHGFRRLQVIEGMRWEGPHLTAAYSIERPLFGGLRSPLRIAFRLHKWGLGYSLAEIDFAEHGLVGRQFVFPTPVDGEHVDVQLAVTVARTAGRDGDALGRRKGGRLVASLARELLIRAFVAEWRKDAPFWETKRYLARPGLDRSDGPVGEFRRYCRQFYPRLPLAEPSGRQRRRAGELPPGIREPPAQSRSIDPPATGTFDSSGLVR